MGTFQEQGLSPANVGKSEGPEGGGKTDTWVSVGNKYGVLLACSYGIQDANNLPGYFLRAPRLNPHLAKQGIHLHPLRRLSYKTIRTKGFVP